MVYSTLVGLSLYELIVYLKHSTKESEDLTEKLKSYEEDIGSIHISVDHQNKNIDKKITNMKETIENFAKTLEDNRNKMMIDLKQTRKLIFRSLDENMELYNQVKDERSQFEKNCESLSLKNIEIMNSILKNGTNDVKFEKE